MSFIINPYRFDSGYEGIISMWQFESDATDAVGSNNGTATSVSYVSGNVGNCADFTSSTSSRIVIPDDASLSFGDGVSDSPFSISYLIYYDVVTSSAWHVSKRDLGTGQEWQVARFASREVFYIFSGGGSSNYLAIQPGSNTSPLVNTWYHIAVTYDGSGTVAGLKMYLDGSLVSTTDVSVGTYVAMNNTTQDIYMGKSSWDTTLSLNGKLDEVAIWDRVLTASEISDLSTDQLAGVDILA